MNFRATVPGRLLAASVGVFLVGCGLAAMLHDGGPWMIVLSVFSAIASAGAITAVGLASVDYPVHAAVVIILGPFVLWVGFLACQIVVTAMQGAGIGLILLAVVSFVIAVLPGGKPSPSEA